MAAVGTSHQAGGTQHKDGWLDCKSQGKGSSLLDKLYSTDPILGAQKSKGCAQKLNENLTPAPILINNLLLPFLLFILSLNQFQMYVLVPISLVREMVDPLPMVAKYVYLLQAHLSCICCMGSLCLWGEIRGKWGSRIHFRRVGCIKC